MTHPPAPEDAEALLLEHRDIEVLLEALLAAVATGALAASADAIARLDDAIRVHSGFEEGLFPAAPEKLVARSEVTSGDELSAQARSARRTALYREGPVRAD